MKNLRFLLIAIGALLVFSIPIATLPLSIVSLEIPEIAVKVSEINVPSCNECVRRYC
jgi:hypothetical protein